MDVELRHLRSFVAVAEELNFTRAAARLHLAQPALSAHVRQLEQRMGCRLLERTTRKVSLTPAGAALLDAAPGALAAVEEAVADAQAAAAGEGGTLAVGMPATSALDLVPRVLRAFAEVRPRVHVSVRSVPFGDPTGGVRSGECDAAIVWLPFDPAGLEVEPLYEDERVVLMAASHALASTDPSQLDVRTVARAPFVHLRGFDEVAADFWTLAEFRDDEPISVGAWITGFEDMFPAIRSGQAIAAIPSSVAAGLPWDDVVTRPVAGLPPATVALCRRAGDSRPVLGAFAAAVRSAL
jgi:DNA-binding transcriptional LysR family regulator